ncbi:MAG: class I SAM-dependent methyltransferase [Gemmatimonadetes bacterium]|jgi:2-polyprenyl-3-methyl-5-hydroxy-6-metoxy-1,4-benzoquinol methylase|nr:class I SAM-dependent methyltransferase [Gemmatimonadota bacterium]
MQSATRLQGKKGLDAGCGGGRYTVALASLGAAKVTGIDYGREISKTQSYAAGARE